MKFALNHYRLLGHSGLRVSPLSLGTMTFGTEWGWGADKAESRRIFDAYADRGGNFIDTANIYTAGTSETFLGEFLQNRRDRFVLATKYTSNTSPSDPNAGGNHRKNMHSAVEASLRRLKTDYIDLYWLHAWDYRTPVEEVMRSFDDLVRQGKILYAAASDTPAWVISQANTLASLRGQTPFIATQIHYNLIDRSAEPELITMCRQFNIAVVPWSPLAGGVLSGKYAPSDLATPKADAGRRDMLLAMGQLTARSLAIVDVVKTVTSEIGRTASQVALNWLLQKPGVVSPIVGARTIAHLDDNLGALDFELSADQMQRLDKASAPDFPFPHNFLCNPRIRAVIDGAATIEGGSASAY